MNLYVNFAVFIHPSHDMFTPPDHIAVREFAWGGMENWGLIVYSDEYLMYDPAIHGLSVKQDVSLIVNHEMAHQVCILNIRKLNCKSINASSTLVMGFPSKNHFFQRNRNSLF